MHDPMDSDLGPLFFALAVLQIPLLLAWGIVSWQDRTKAQRNRRRS
jgi:hypothetical protein